MAKLVRLNEIEGKQFLKRLQIEPIVIYEDVQGSKIFVKWTNQGVEIRPKRSDADPLNPIDLAVQKYYGLAYDYLRSLKPSIISLLKKGWQFCFEYFPDEQPAHVKYDIVPQNNLVLTCILKGKKYVQDFEELDEYARVIGVDSVPVLFKGVLSEVQYDLIERFLSTSQHDLEYIFDQDSNFSHFFYSILCPGSKSSFLMLEGNFQENSERLIIRFEDNDEINLALLNPMYKKGIESDMTEHVEVYSLFLLSFIEYSQLIDIKTIKAEGDNRGDLYLDIMCKMFNRFITANLEQILDFEFDIPKFFREEKFKIDPDRIKNNITLQHLRIDPKIEYVFKVIVGSFQRKRTKPIGIFNDMSVIVFNDIVDKIQTRIDEITRDARPVSVLDKGTLTFDEYMSADAEGHVYPDVYNKFDKEPKVDGGKKKDFKKGWSFKDKDKTSPVPDGSFWSETDNKKDK